MSFLCPRQSLTKKVTSQNELLSLLLYFRRYLNHLIGRRHDRSGMTEEYHRIEGAAINSESHDIFNLQNAQQYFVQHQKSFLIFLSLLFASRFSSRFFSVFVFCIFIVCDCLGKYPKIRAVWCRCLRRNSGKIFKWTNTDIQRFILVCKVFVSMVNILLL